MSLWVKDAANLPNNKCYADRFVIQAEKRLKRDSFMKSHIVTRCRICFLVMLLGN